MTEKVKDSQGFKEKQRKKEQKRKSNLLIGDSTLAQGIYRINLFS